MGIEDVHEQEHAIVPVVQPRDQVPTQTIRRVQVLVEELVEAATEPEDRRHVGRVADEGGAVKAGRACSSSASVGASGFKW